MNLPSLSRFGSIAMFLLAGRRSPINTIAAQNIVSGLIVVVGLAVAIAMFASLLLVVALYGGYVALVHNGLDQGIAMLVIGLMMAAMICILVLVLQTRFNNLRVLAQTLIQPDTGIASGITSGVSGVTGAFMDGLMGKPKPFTRH